MEVHHVIQQQCCELKTTWHISMCITINTMLNRKYSSVLLPEHLTSVDKEIQIVCQEQLLLVLMCLHLWNFIMSQLKTMPKLSMVCSPFPA